MARAVSVCFYRAVDNGGPTRGFWTGRIGFVLAAAGSAIGLGNIWKFPFTAGRNGGAIFVFVYLAAVLFVGLPILIAEISIGRASRRNPVGAFRALRPGAPWVAAGWLGVASGFLILAFYGVVAGWALDYVFLSLRGAFHGLSTSDVEGMFGTLVANPWRQAAWQAAFMGLTIGIVAGGIEHGIERSAKVMMPALLVVLLCLLAYGLTLPGAGDGLAFLLSPRWEDFTSRAVLAALGQAFFSLSLGMGAMITYGSYLDDRASLARAGSAVVVADTAIAILAGLVIFPIVFTFDLEPGAGPGLTFQTLPVAFSQLPATRFLSTAFFLLLTFAALTSAISLLEVVVAYLVDEHGWRRSVAASVAGGLIFAIGLPCAFDSVWIDRFDFLTSNVMLPVGGIGIAVFAGWALTDGEQERQLGDGAWLGVWRALVRWVAPLAVGIVFFSLIFS